MSTGYAIEKMDNIAHWRWIFGRLSPFLWPLLACLVGWRQLSQHMDSAIQYDAQHTYLPYAQRFLNEGWSFLLTPESYQVVPLAYLWLAVWQVETQWIRFANCGLWVCCVFFLWSSARQLGGERAGIVALALWLVNPEIHRYFPSELTEPIFLFGLLCWTWSMLGLIQRPNRWLIGAAALGLCITLLSRPVLQLMAPLGLLVCVFFLCWTKFKKRQYAWVPSVKAIAWSLALGMLIPVALVIKNILVFGLWGLGTGAGSGIYLGTHILFQGAEPIYLGFNFDNVLYTRENFHHLGVEEDGAARLVGMWQLASMPLGDALAFLLRKLWWWLAHHPAVLLYEGAFIRQLRLLEIGMVLWALGIMAYTYARGGRQALVQRLLGHPLSMRLVGAAFLLLMFLGLLAQLLPILYNSRYSTTLLGPWLILLAAWAFSIVTAPLRTSWRWRTWALRARSPHGIVPLLLVAAAPVALASAAYNYAKKHDVLAIDQPGPTRTVRAVPAAPVAALNLTPSGKNRWVTTEPVAVLTQEFTAEDVDALAASPVYNALWRLEWEISPKGRSCKPAHVAYQQHDGTIREGFALPLRSHGQRTTAYVHANRTLRPDVPGRLHITLSCPVGSEVTWFGAALLESTYSLEWTRRFEARQK